MSFARCLFVPKGKVETIRADNYVICLFFFSVEKWAKDTTLQRSFPPPQEASRLCREPFATGSRTCNFSISRWTSMWPPTSVDGAPPYFPQDRLLISTDLILRQGCRKLLIRYPATHRSRGNSLCSDEQALFSAQNMRCVDGRIRGTQRSTSKDLCKNRPLQHLT